MTNKEIIFRASAVKLREGKHDKTTLSWNAQGASTIILELAYNNHISVANTGSYILSPQVTTTYGIKAVFPDGELQIKHIKIEVFPEALLTYDVVEKIEGDNVNAELTWNVTNTKSVKLNNDIVASSGYKKQLVDRTISNTIQYEDEFGIHSKTIHIANENKSFWLIPNAIKILLRPITPIGYVGQKEMRLTNVLSILLLVPILTIFIINNWTLVEREQFDVLFMDYNFATTKYLICFILYVWLMQLAKRLKDVGKSPYNILFFFPIMIFTFILGTVNIENDMLEGILVGYGLYFGIMLITCKSLSSIKSKHKKKYNKIKVW